MANDVIFDFEVKFRLRRFFSLRIVDLVSELRIASLLQCEISLGGNDFHFLEGVRLGKRNPYANLLARGQVLHREGVVKCETARLLGEGG
jgi:hypothetical protein